MNAGTGPELVLQGGQPIVQQIHTQIRDLILSGELRPGEELPTVRALAVGLAVNPAPVAGAYVALEREGFVSTAEGSGTFVALPEHAATQPPRAPTELEAMCRDFLARVVHRGFTATRPCASSEHLPTETLTMTSMRLDPEATLLREHTAREVQRAGTFILNLVLALAVLGAGALPQVLLGAFSPVITAAAVAAALAVLLSLRVALHWDRAVVLRLGRFHALKGPGVYGLVPFLDRVARCVDMRIRATEFFSESTLTRDTVPVSVDAICFWLVWDAQKSVLEVENYYRAISLSAQTGLRDTIGTHTLEEMLTQREALGKALQEVLDRKTNPWGISVQSVEIRDVSIPSSLQDAMSKQAQAERERQARIILGTAETEIASKFVEAARPYQNNPVAIHLRAMNMLYEGLKEKGSMIIVPSTAVESMNLGAVGGLMALGQGNGVAGEKVATVAEPLSPPLTGPVAAAPGAS
jgi:regulator of protease activity HflC (stomatin/prohibitin superfamily)/DNA-binding transcriptional regulator YhcF (GntR family)